MNHDRPNILKKKVWLVNSKDSKVNYTFFITVGVMTRKSNKTLITNKKWFALLAIIFTYYVKSELSTIGRFPSDNLIFVV